MIEVIIPIITAFVGYYLGTLKFFRESQLRAYADILHPIVKAAYDPSHIDEREFNKAVANVWLFCNREVALKMNKALSILADPKRGDFADAIQSAIIAMRQDIRPLTYSEELLSSEEITHLYFKLGLSNKDVDKGIA